MNTPVFIVLSKPHHGKTEARKILAELTYLKGGSCSDVIYHFLAARRETTVDALRRLPKEELRPDLIMAGDFLCGLHDSMPDAPNKDVDSEMYRVPSLLCRTLYLSGYNVIDGIRRKAELKEFRGALNWNGVRSLVVWIDRPGFPTVEDNTEVGPEMADELVLNDGTIDDLRVKLKAVLEKHFGVQDSTPAPIPVVDLPTSDKPKGLNPKAPSEL